MANFDDDDDLESASLESLYHWLEKITKYNPENSKSMDSETAEALKMLVINQVLEEIKRRENHEQQSI